LMTVSHSGSELQTEVVRGGGGGIGVFGATLVKGGSTDNMVTKTSRRVRNVREARQSLTDHSQYQENLIGVKDPNFEEDEKNGEDFDFENPFGHTNHPKSMLNVDNISNLSSSQEVHKIEPGSRYTSSSSISSSNYTVDSLFSHSPLLLSESDRPVKMRELEGGGLELLTVVDDPTSSSRTDEPPQSSRKLMRVVTDSS